MSAAGPHESIGLPEPARTAVRRERQRTAQPNGIWGMALFLCAETALFGTMFGAYYYLDFSAHQWPPPGIKPEAPADPSIATAWLVVTLLPIVLAVGKAKRGERRAAIWWTVLAMVLQGGYLAFQITLYVDDFHHFKPQFTAYGSIYYTIMTLDHAHVAFGLALDLVLIVKLWMRGLTNYWLIAMRGLGIYWYVVVVLTVLVLFVQLSPTLSS